MRLTFSIHLHPGRPLGWGSCDGDCEEVEVVGEVVGDEVRVVSVDGLPAEWVRPVVVSDAEECIWRECVRRKERQGAVR